MSDDKPLIEQILEQALSLESEERNAFLEEACGSDTDLRREIDQLLAHHEAAEQDSFLAGDDAAPLPKLLDGGEPAQPDVTQTHLGSRNGSTSTGLLKRVRANDQEAWTVLVNLYGPLVYSWCRNWELKAPDAADVVQEVFKSVFRGLKSFDRGGPNQRFRAWLWTISQNKMRDHFRVRKSQGAGGSSALQRLQQTPDAEAFDSTLSLAEGSRGLARRAYELAEAKFSHQTLQAFILTAVEGLDATEVGRRLEMTPNAVRSAKARVLRYLRGMLAGGW